MVRALVTGASRGIGRAIARALLVESASVALAVREPESVAQLVEGSGGFAAPRAVALAVDLRQAEQVDGLIDRAVAVLGGLDVLVNCAGVVLYRPLGEVSRDELAEQLEINFIAPFVLSQAAAMYMSAHGGGAIVNVASTLGLRPAPRTAAYGASKAALIALTRSVALEFGSAGVRANALAPGLIETDMIRVPRDPSVPVDAQLKALGELALLKRLGTPEEIAEAALFLIRNPYITGSVLVADGGVLLA